MRTFPLASCLLFLAIPALAQTVNAPAVISAAEEHTGKISVTISRSDPTTGTTTVQYATTDDGAKAGSDYVATSGTLTFNPGESTRIVDVPLIDNDVWTNRARMFSLTLSNVTGGFLGARQTASLRINEDDPQPVVHLTGLVQTEGNNGWHDVTATMSLVGKTEVDGTISVASVSGDSLTSTAEYNHDIRYTQFVWNFTPADVGTQKQFTYQINGDAIYEADEHLDFHVFTINVRGELDELAARPGKFVIINDDPVPSVTATDVTTNEGTGPEATTVTMTFQSSAPTTGTVRYTLTDGSATRDDYFADPYSGTITFRDETTKTLSIIISGDSRVEGRETFYVGLSDPVNLSLARNRIAVDIIDDDTFPNVSLSPASVELQTGNSATMTITLSKPASASGTIALSSSSAAVSVPSSVPIAAGETSVTFSAIAVSAPAQATITATLPSSLGSGLATASVITTNANARLVVTPSRLRLVAGASGRLSISLSPHSAQPVTATISVNDPSIVEVPSTTVIPLSGSVTIPVVAKNAGRTTVSVVASSPAGPASGSAIVEVVAASTVLLTPSAGGAAGGTQIAVTGDGISPACSLTLGGLPARELWSTGGVLMATTPQHAAGSVDVEITCTDMTLIVPSGFTFAETRRRASSH